MNKTSEKSGSSDIVLSRPELSCLGKRKQCCAWGLITDHVNMISKDYLWSCSSVVIPPHTAL